MNKETQITLLREIRDLLKNQQAISLREATHPILAEQDYWTLKVPQGMTIEKALAECKKLFPVWRWTDRDLDTETTSDRTTKKAYTVKFKANVEADEELKSLSADELKARGIKGITLLERILLELQYFKANGQHLDIRNVTLCTGSRGSGGSVPDAHWYDGKFYVSWYYAGCSHSVVRARATVVS